MSNYNLSSIINELLIELGHSGNNYFARFYQFGVSFLRRTNMDTSGFPKIVKLTLNDNDTANLPDDYIKYTKVAFCINGKMVSLGLNNNICLDKNYDDCGNLVRNINSAIAGFGIVAPTAIADNIRNGEAMGRMFGVGSEFNVLGSFRIDKPSNTIQFADLNIDGDIVMEYIADIDSQNGDFQVHPFMVEAIKNYIVFMYKIRSSKPLGEQQLAELHFNNENRKMRQRFMSNTLEEWNAALNSANNQTPKLG